MDIPLSISCRTYGDRLAVVCDVLFDRRIYLLFDVAAFPLEMSLYEPLHRSAPPVWHF